MSIECSGVWQEKDFSLASVISILTSKDKTLIYNAGGVNVLIELPSTNFFFLCISLVFEVPKTALQ